MKLEEFDYEQCNDWEDGRRYFTTATIGNRQFRIVIDQDGEGSDLDDIVAKIQEALS